MTDSKFEGMDRDALFNSYFVTRLGITRHVPMADALLYVLEELHRLHEENMKKNQQIQLLEYEVQQLKYQTTKLGPNYGNGWDPYKSPFTYGPNITSTTGAPLPAAGDDVTINTTTAIGGVGTTVSATDIHNAYEKMKSMGLLNKDVDDTFQTWYSSKP